MIPVEVTSGKFLFTFSRKRINEWINKWIIKTEQSVQLKFDNPN